MKKSRRFDASNVEGYIVKARKIDKSRNLAKSGKVSNKFPHDGARRRTLNLKITRFTRMETVRPLEIDGG
jgi:hypothetical protein